jgi:cobalt-zinc-cadmium efflux system membrane fusion protein
MKSLTTLFLLATTLVLASCSDRASPEADDHGHDGQHTEEIAQGPHGGRLLRSGDVAVELAIVETGARPEFHAWFWRDGQPLPPTAGTLAITLQRLGQTPETHAFLVRGDILVGNFEVREPHSFDVVVTAQLGGRPLRWMYPSYEGRTSIAAAVAEQSGIRVAPASAGIIRDEHDVQGLLTPIEGRHAKVVARFPGPIRSVAVGVGDEVRAGQTLATVESNLSLSTYAVTSPLAGTVLSREAGVGELAGDAALFEVADLSKLWVDLHLFGGDAQHITRGLPVLVTRLSDGVTATTQLDRVLPATATASQSTVARSTLDNRDGRWRPGAAVKARITVAETPVALVVPIAALQRLGDREVVFIRVGEDYEARPLELGRRDGSQVEVLDGLRVGDVVVVAQSYLIKADIEKHGAAHEH